MHHQQLAAQHDDEKLKSAIVCIVPANEHDITKLPQQRIREFRTYIQKCIDEAIALATENSAATSTNPEKTDSLHTTESGFERDTMTQACSTCLGYCCLNGGRTHTYQTGSYILRFIQRNPASTPDVVLKQYLEHIPQTSYQDSCIYHTDTGCTLPRDMR